MFDRMTQSAKEAVRAARTIALEHGSNTLDEVHLLLGCLRATGSAVPELLLACGQDPIEVAARAQAIAASAPRVPGAALELGQVPFTQDAKRALECAVEEAAGLDHDYIGCEHLLLGSLRAAGRVGEMLAHGGLKRLELQHAVLARANRERSGE